MSNTSTGATVAMPRWALGSSVDAPARNPKAPRQLPHQQVSNRRALSQSHESHHRSAQNSFSFSEKTLASGEENKAHEDVPANAKHVDEDFQVTF
jgi:hypothetical protein